MIVITLSDRRPTSADEQAVDVLDRTYVGYSPDMTPQEIYAANHGYWVIGTERLNTERYALFIHEHIGRVAVEIDYIERVTVKDRIRSVIHGRILSAGHPIYDTYVGKASPLPSGDRNPLRYYDAQEEYQACRCGCGEPVHGSAYVRGHEQTALHERVKRIGTVAEFIDWFDALHRPFRAAAESAQ